MANNYERRPNRSDRYQELFHETVVSNDMMESFPNDDSISSRLSGGFAYDESVLELEDQLKEEFWRIVNDLLTPRQRDVIRLCAEGYTQMEIAKMLNVNQSSITKSLNGNVDYKHGNRKTYGGTKRKLNKIIDNDEKILNILKQINEKRGDKW
jgi:predicted transcriptional regulator